MKTRLAKILKAVLRGYTYLSAALVTVMIAVVMYGHVAKTEQLPPGFANPKAGAAISLLNSTALRDLSITQGSQSSSSASLRLVSVQGLSITPGHGSYFFLIGSSVDGKNSR
jgi:hypothetical protein